MAEKLFNDDEYESRRFTCDCLSPGHALDVSIEYGRMEPMLTLEAFVAGGPLSYRLKEALKIIKGQDGCIESFILREEDADELIRLLKFYKQKLKEWRKGPVSMTDGTATL